MPRLASIHINERWIIFFINKVCKNIPNDFYLELLRIMNICKNCIIEVVDTFSTYEYMILYVRLARTWSFAVGSKSCWQKNYSDPEFDELALIYCNFSCFLVGSESDHWICIYNQIIESGVLLSIIVSTENCNANAKYLRNAYHFLVLRRCIIMNQNIKCKTSHYSHFFIKNKITFCLYYA